MNPIEIKVEIAKRGLTQKQMAEEIGTRPDTLSRLINGFAYFPLIAKAIEDRYGIIIPPPTSKRMQGVELKKLVA
ncbi:MAG: helix-turn-helix transcriptional regulator [Pyrinomonadaceae bacterium]|nr:helix-turn-helix transcriptional regulator [Pyrinomonadaceae bacterium]